MGRMSPTSSAKRGMGVFQPTNQRSFDAAYVSRLEEENRASVSRLSDYVRRRQSDEWMDEDTLTGYRDAVKRYKSSSSALSNLRRHLGEADDNFYERDSYISSISDDIDSASKSFGQYKNAEEYGKALSAYREREEMKKASLDDLSSEIADLERKLASKQKRSSRERKVFLPEDVRAIHDDLEAKRAYYTKAKEVQDLESHTAAELYQLAAAAMDGGRDNTDSLYWRGLANERDVQEKASILAGARMDGEGTTVLEALNGLSSIEDGADRKQREKAIRAKMASLGVGFDDYYSRITGEGNFSWGNALRWTGAALASGLGSWNKGLTSTLDLVLGKPLQALGWESNPVTATKKYFSDVYDTNVFNRSLYAERMGGGQALEYAGQFAEGLVSAIPDAILAAMSAGASAGAGITSEGLAAKAAYASGDRLTKAGLTVEGMMKNPSYWGSFAREYGLDYEDAKASGASDEAAALGATITALINAGVEIGFDGGSGFQGLAQDLAEGERSKFWAWVESSLEEGGEEILQGFVTNLVSKAMYDDSTELADIEQMIAEGGMGVAVGAALGGGEIILRNTAVDAVRNREIRQVMRSYDEFSGRSVIENGNVQKLIDDAQGLGNSRAETALKKLAGKVAGVPADTEALTGRAKRKAEVQVGQLYRGMLEVQDQAVRDRVTGSVADNIREALTADGVENVDAVTDALVKKAQGKQIGQKQAAFIEGIDADSIIRNAEKAATENVSAGAAAAYAKMMDTAETATVAREAREVGAKTVADLSERVSDNGKTVIANTGEEVTIDRKNAFKIGKDGETYLNTDKGDVKIGDVAFANTNEALLYEAVADMSPAIASTIVSNYDGSIPVRTYVNGMRQGVEVYGRYNFRQVGVDISDKSFFAELHPADQKLALALGRQFAAAKTVEEQKAVPAVKAKNSENGKVSFVQGVSAETDMQKNGVELAKVLAKATGINIEFFDSTLDTKRKNDNGWYDPKTDTIHVDINAGDTRNGTIAYTLGHELTHFIKKWSPAKFKTFGDFLLEQYGEHGVDTQTMLEAQMQKLGTRDTALAYEELVADACQTMLLDSNAVEKLAQLRQQDKTLFEKIREFITGLIDKIRGLYRDIEPDSAEAKAVRNMTDVLEQLSALFEDAAVDAAKAHQGAAEAVGAAIDAEGGSVSPAFSLRTWKGSDYVQDRENAAKEIAEALGVSVPKAKAYIDDINSVGYMISSDLSRLDYEETGLSPFVGNAEYGGSFDYTTLCTKRRLLTGTFSAIQRALPNTALTAQEILDIRKMMDDAGLEVNCGKCYVEGSRANMGKFTKRFIELYREYHPGKWYPNMAEMNTPDGIEWVRVNHPEVYEQYEYFWNHYGTLKPGDPNLFASQQKPKLYQMRSAYSGEVLRYFKGDAKVEEKNRNGGIRMQSFSDFEIVHLIDAMQTIMDMSRVGLNGQAYTKMPDFAWALGNTGLKINLSIDAWSVGEDGKLVFNNKEGMPFDTAMKLRDAYSANVGTICCVYDDTQLLAALADDRIDFVIPFHRSQWKKSQYKAMGLPSTTKDYTYQQNEKWIDPSQHTHEFRGRQVKEPCTNYMPNEYWDFSKSGKENAEAYLAMCARDGKRPKFYKLLDRNADGSYSLKADGSTDGYWKLLIDFKMYDNDGVGSPQMPVRPDFNMAECTRMLNEYKGGHEHFPVAQGIVDAFVERYKKSHANDSNADIRRSTRMRAETQDELTDKYKAAVDDVLAMRNTKTDNLIIGYTPELMHKMGMPSLPFVIGTGHVYSAAKTDAEAKQDGNFRKGVHYHGLGADVVKNIYGQLQDPVMIIAAKDVNKNATPLRSTHSVVAIVDIGKAGTSLLLPVEITAERTVGGQRMDVNVLSSVYEKPVAGLVTEAIALENSGDVGIYYAKKEATTLIGAGVQFPVQLQAMIASDPIIRSFDEKVNRNISDATQSQQFKRWFGDWQNDPEKASKVVDTDGTPLVMYHGTKAENGDFTVFDYSKAVKKGGLGLKALGKGNYFTSKPLDGSERFGSRVIKAYLSIKNPFVYDASNGDAVSLAEQVAKKTGANTKGLGHDALQDKMRELGYDGVIEYRRDGSVSIAVTFDSTQIKSATDNIGTFDGNEPDIRYSKRNVDERYTYDALVSKPDMTVTQLEGDVPDNRADVVAKAKKNAAKIGKFNTKDGSVSVHVDDIDADVVLATQGLRHGLRRTSNLTSDINAFVALHAGEIVSNSIRINELTPSKADATGSFVLIGAAKRGNDLYLVRSVVNRYELTSMNVLYALKTKKEESGALNAPRSTTTPSLATSLPFTDSTISISSLLDIVNENFPDILPEDVLKHYGHTERPEGDLGRSALYSTRNKSNREILSEALLTTTDPATPQGEYEAKLLVDYKAKAAELDALQAHLAEVKREIYDRTFGDLPHDAARLSVLRDDKIKTENRIGIYDKKLLRLEATKPLMELLEREKAKVKRQTAGLLQDAFREKTTKIANRAMRKRITSVVHDLDRLLNRGTKERNVKLGMRETVGATLSLANVIFNDEITNEDIVKAGAETATEKEQKLLKRYADLMQKRDTSEYSVAADCISELRKLDKRLADLFARERARLNQTKVSEAVDQLAREYGKLKTAEQGHINFAYDGEVAERISALSRDLAGTVANDMSAEQLKEVYDIFKIVKHMVSESDKLFRMGKAQSLSETTETVQSEILSHMKENRKDPGAAAESIAEAARGFVWNELKPVYAFERLGSKAYMDLFWDAIEAEGVWAKDVQEAKEYLDEQVEKTGYRKWDMQKAHTFTLQSGKQFTLTLQDIMSVYAYSKRDQAYEHMTTGGFQFADRSEYKEGGKRKVHLTGELYTVTLDDIRQIIGELTEEQTAYVDAVQSYLSVLGKKGNEVSRQLYGIDIFTEAAYFPLMSSRDYRSSVETTLNATQTQVSLKNTGMTKQTVPHAKNPIILQGFDSVVSRHIDQMAKYHAYVLPIENLRRVFDSVSPAIDQGEEYTSTKNIIKKVFGRSAMAYFDQYITDLNGGTLVKGYNAPLMGLFSKFKGTAVGASLSVIIQQPFAITRAMDMISPRYFLPGDVQKPDTGSRYEEIKRYAPVAIVKEMGGFDMGNSRTAVDYLTTRTDKGLRRAVDTVNEAAGWGAGKADELGWGIIWDAVKREVAAVQKLKPGTDEFFKACGKRFTEVVVYTQVYDSVNSRSGMMRSKNDLMKFATSFMGEPTTVINMAYNAMLKVQRATGKEAKHVAKRALARTMGVLVVSQLLTAIAKSVVYAGRDDDDDEAYLERFAGSLGSSLDWRSGDLNPLTMIPFIRDIISIWEGYSIDRPDMTLIANLVSSVKRSIDGDFTVDDALSLIGDAGNIFGLPVRNLIRDAKGIINFFGDIFDGIYPTDIVGAFARGLNGTEQSNTEALYGAIDRGDEGRLDVIREKYKTDTSYASAVKRSLRENDPRVRQALKARVNGDTATYMKIRQQIIDEGKFDKQAVTEALKAEYDYYVGKINEAERLLRGGDKAASDDIIQELKKKYKGTFSQDDIMVAVKRKAGLQK